MNQKYSLGGVKPPFFFVLALLLFSTGMGTAAAANPIVAISASETTVCVGDDFQLYISVDPNGNTLQQVMTDLGYDSSKVSLTVSDSGLFEYMFDPGTPDTNSIDAIMGLSDGVSTAGNLAVISMHADNPGTFTLSLSEVSVGTASGSLTPDVNQGTVTINVCDGGAQGVPVVEIFPAYKTVCVGDTFQVFISVDPDVNTLEQVMTDLGYDSSKVSLTVSDGGMFEYMFDAGTPDTNSIDAIMGLSDGVSTAGNLAVLTMHADNPGTFTLDLTEVSVGTADGTLTPEVNPGTVTINECLGPLPNITNPAEGDTITGIVNITEVEDSGRNVTYNLFEYSPDGSAWTEIGNDTDGSDGWWVLWNTKAVVNGSYYIRATMGDNESLTGSDQISVTVDNPPLCGISLESGWNFISVPCVLDNDTVEHVLDGVDYESIVWYDASDQTWDNPSEIVPLTAYFINVSDEYQVIENIERKIGYGLPNSRQMYAGWNPVGLTGFEPRTAEYTFYLGDIDDHYSKVWGPYKEGDYTQHGFNKNIFGDIPDPGEEPPDVVYTGNYSMELYQGHWIYMTSDAVLSVIA